MWGVGSLGVVRSVSLCGLDSFSEVDIVRFYVGRLDDD